MDELLARAGLDPECRTLYPHELSGGMAQRAAIAFDTRREPAVIVADEPTSSLDPDLTERILTLLDGCADAGASVLLITHDIAAARRHADAVSVMYAGRILESGPAADVLDDPWHDYTKDLMAALPGNGLRPMPGTPPELTDLPDDCVYHLRRPGTAFSGAGPSSSERRARGPHPRRRWIVSLIAEHLRAGHRPDIPVLDDVGIEIARGRTIGLTGLRAQGRRLWPGCAHCCIGPGRPGERGRRRRVPRRRGSAGHAAGDARCCSSRRASRRRRG